MQAHTNHSHEPPHQQAPQTAALPYPSSPDRTIHIAVTTLPTSYLIFLTSGTASALSNSLLQPPSGLADSDLAVDSETSFPDAGADSGLGPASGLETDPEGMTSALSPLGSFVYGLPNRISPTEPLTTPLVSVPATLELATRICRILVLRLARVAAPRAVYVGCSIVVDGLADRVREEIDVVRAVVEGVVGVVAQHGEKQVNGAHVENEIRDGSVGRVS